MQACQYVLATAMLGCVATIYSFEGVQPLARVHKRSHLFRVVGPSAVPATGQTSPESLLWNDPFGYVSYDHFRP